MEERVKALREKLHSKRKVKKGKQETEVQDDGIGSAPINNGKQVEDDQNDGICSSPKKKRKV